VFSQINTSKIRRKIKVIGSVLIVAPILMVCAAGFLVLHRINQTAILEGITASSEKLTNLTQSLVEFCRNYHRQTVEKLRSGRTILDAAGEISLDPEKRVKWRARNELTGDVTFVKLPALRVGKMDFLPVPDFTHPAPVVDGIQLAQGIPATILQRMNERGDMLRICTSVKTETGDRDIGAYMSVDSTDITVRDALREVLGGRSYVCRRSISKTSFFALFDPLKDRAGNVIGMLYSTLEEDQVSTKIRSVAASNTRLPEAELFAFQASGNERGTAFIAGDKRLEGHNLWAERDSSGRPYVQEICSRALATIPGEVIEYKYQKAEQIGRMPRTMISRFAYVPELDWVVGYEQPESQSLAGLSPTQGLAIWGMWLMFGAGVAGSWIALQIWLEYSDFLARKLISRLSDLRKNARQLSVIAAELAVTKRGEEGNVIVIDTAAGDVLRKSQQTTVEINLAISHLHASRHSFNTVIDAIDQIAFAANMLAANAAIEGSQAGEDVSGIAGVAEELRRLAERCRAAAHSTEEELEQSWVELERGNEEVRTLLSSLRPTINGPQAPVIQQAESLRQLAQRVGRSIELIGEDLCAEVVVEDNEEGNL
jgi:hypothetical protein